MHYEKRNIQWKILLLSLAISLGVGFLSANIVKNSADIYEGLVKPALSPSAAVFPIVWTILFILMGISAYLIYVSDADKEKKVTALLVYVLQLVVNFVWPILFFGFNAYGLSFLWLLLLWVLIMIMIFTFYPISKSAALLQLPYLLWVTFAGYLNFMIYQLN